MVTFMGTYILFRLAGLLAPRVPRRLAYAVLGLAAAVAYRVAGARRLVIEDNVRHVLGNQADAEVVAGIVRRIFHNLFKNYFDLFWLPAQPTEAIARLITVHGMENAQAAFAMGKGVIAVSAHMGNQEVITQVKAITDYKLTVVIEHLKNERVYQYIKGLRQTTGMTLIPPGSALKEIFRALKRNEAVGLVFDRDTTNSGRVIPFFGYPARLPDGYAILALKTGAPVVPAFILRDGDDRYAAYIEEPIVLEGRADNDDDVRRGMMRVGTVVERYIRRYLDQWVYFHRVFMDDGEGKHGT